MKGKARSRPSLRRAGRSMHPGTTVNVEEGSLRIGLAEIEPLSRDHRRIVLETVDQVTHLLILAANEGNLSGRQLCERSQLAVDTLDLVFVHPDPERLDQVADALEPVEVDEPVEVGRHEAEARARLRLDALYQRIIRDSYSVADLRSRVSRQRLKQLRDRDRLFAIDVPFFKGKLYPRWQFGLATGKPRAIMPELIKAGREAGMDAISFHQTMLSPAAGGGDLTPVDLLDAGEEEAVLRILQAGDQ